MSFLELFSSTLFQVDKIVLKEIEKKHISKNRNLINSKKKM